MAKYHIKADGTPGVCRATKRPCPLGGDDKHYDSMEEAQVAADKQNEAEFGLISQEKSKAAKLSERVSTEKGLLEYQEEYFSKHPYLHDSFDEFQYEIEDKMANVKKSLAFTDHPDSIARDIGRRNFITVEPDELVEITALWRGAFDDQEQFDEVLKFMSESNGMSNGRWRFKR